MPSYLCSELITDSQGNQDCQIWTEAPQTLAQELAITEDQAQELSTAIALVFLTAWAIQKVAHVIQSRRY